MPLARSLFATLAREFEKHRAKIMDNAKLIKIINSSGFPLQIGIEDLIKNSHQNHGWSVLSSEHAWENLDNGRSGFIDLVLEDHHKTSVLVVECKRVIDSSWLFLNPDKSIKNRTHVKAWVTKKIGSKTQYFGWKDLTASPDTPESAFCVVAGQDAKSKPMLERVAHDVVESTDGFANEEHINLVDKFDSLRMYFNVIITTAKLKVCSFDPSQVSMEDGKFDDTEITEVPFLRFRKQLSPRSLKNGSLITDGFYSLIREKENTVFVVNAEHLLIFLKDFEVNSSSLRDLN